MKEKKRYEIVWNFDKHAFVKNRCGGNLLFLIVQLNRF